MAKSREKFNVPFYTYAKTSYCEVILNARRNQMTRRINKALNIAMYGTMATMIAGSLLYATSLTFGF